MDTKIFKTFSSDFYNFARNNDLKNAKETYLLFLEKAKDCPSVAKLIFNQSLNLRKDTFFRQAKQSALINGTCAPIKEAVDKNQTAFNLLAKIKGDKDVKHIQKEIDKAINKMYKKTKKIRQDAVITNYDKVSLDEARYNREHSWLNRLFN